MTMYTYTALDRTGRRTTGTVPADTRSAAMDQVMELESHLQTLAARTPDTQEAIRAFIEKRKPSFRG